MKLADQGRVLWFMHQVFVLAREIYPQGRISSMIVQLRSETVVGERTNGLVVEIPPAATHAGTLRRSLYAHHC
jgi:hypothetical protein|eukprot:COSAG01_NODE_5126_length_4469_cov_14.074600_5_plen_73_part_00